MFILATGGRPQEGDKGVLGSDLYPVLRSWWKNLYPCHLLNHIAIERASFFLLLAQRLVSELLREQLLKATHTQMSCLVEDLAQSRFQ